MTIPKPLTDEELAQRRRCVKADLEDLAGKDLSDDYELREALVLVQREARYLATIDERDRQVERQGKLLVCYRVGTRPSGKVLDGLAAYQRNHPK